ncbi:GNAT family N-acetyltransferase [Polyangium mundeleinium]|uniref:GNAT family N-acetyltransferase n=1 Tax=Polyangium mundeleinium TaxID=2995306 RepID=A0ABT5EFK2_9BACT|nr:GNAT family N-acetyltransferase [Polyangium mundeleinium]MDC0740595.1 GNAT family N-acetyltransferase [Polyangium mundeleinium]
MNGALVTTERLTIRKLTPADAPFILRLVNDPDFLRYIGDRGVRTLEDAEAYLRNGPIASYERNGHGLWGVALTATGELMGMSGLLKREEYADVDIGYAFLPEFRGGGYAFESGSAVLRIAAEVLALRKVIALVSPANAASIGLLIKFGFTRSAMEAEDSNTVLYEWVPSPP